jgi:prolactin regulatory element-binding protein
MLNRFHPQDPQILYTVCNTIPPRTVKTRNPARPAFLCKWDTQQWEVVKVQKLSERGVTCFDARYKFRAEPVFN